MKKRVISLALVMSLLISMLFTGALAEELIEPEYVAEPADEYLMPEQPVEEEISFEDEVYVDDAAPAGDVPAVEEQPAVEEAPAADPQPAGTTEDPAPAEEQLEAAAPSVISMASGFQDSFDQKVLGSANVQYAGVTYLSQAAFNSMKPAGQSAYIEMVDEVTNLLDRAVPLEDVVFAVDKKGNLHFNISIPMSEIYTWNGSEIAEEVIVEEPEQEELVEELPQEAPSGDAFVEPAAVEPSAEPVSENMELIDQLETPTEIIEGSISLENSMAILGDVEGKEFNTLFWNNKKYFYKQISSQAKKFYNAGYKAMVKSNKNKFTTTFYGGYQASDISSGLSALVLTYPTKFDWIKPGGSARTSGLYYPSTGKYSLTTTVDKSKYYSASLEKQAQNKVKELVNAAYAEAKSSYLGGTTYNLVSYFNEWLCDHNYYNMAGTDDSQKESRTFYYCHNSYGVLLKGYGVCDSYAHAMSRLLDAAGIPNLYVPGYGVSGSSREPHAWNYVQMPDGEFYLLDSTWADGGSVIRDEYVLGGDDGNHIAMGLVYGNATFDFPEISRLTYLNEAEPIRLNRSTAYLAKGKTTTLKLSTTYYNKYKMTWSSDNKSVAKVSKKGKVTAVAPGHANISLRIGNSVATCSVYVYQFTSLRFADINKASRTYTCRSSLMEPQVFTINVNQKNRANTTSAAAIVLGKKPKFTVSTSKKSVATAEASLAGDTITLTVTPKKRGTATIKVKLGGKTATLTFKVK